MRSSVYVSQVSAIAIANDNFHPGMHGKRVCKARRSPMDDRSWRDLTRGGDRHWHNQRFCWQLDAHLTSQSMRALKARSSSSCPSRVSVCDELLTRSCFHAQRSALSVQRSTVMMANWCRNI